jgi:hypothetical protein
MRQLTITFTIFILASTVLFAQDFETKGVKIEYYDLTPMASIFTFKAEAQIQKITTGPRTEYFYKINLSLTDTLVASLTLNELVEARAALNILLQKSKKDKMSKADGILNRYNFENGFSIGYVLSDKKVTWFLSQENGTQEGALTAKSISAIAKTFAEATIIIEQLKNE